MLGQHERELEVALAAVAEFPSMSSNRLQRSARASSAGAG